MFRQINIKEMLIAELNVKLRNLKKILIRIMIVIIIVLITVVIKITTTIIIIIIIIHLQMKITQDTSTAQEIQCSYLEIVLSKM